MLNLLYTLLLTCAAVSASVPIPDDDPFYRPPAGFESSVPGTVLGNRTISSGIPGASAVQLLYRTTYTNGSAGATVATVVSGLLSLGNKLVAYSEPEDSVNTTCAPSYVFSVGNGSSFGSDITNGLDNGWTIVVSDYEGFGSAFGAGRQAGYAVLDALRAALNYAPLKVSKDATVGGYGYSGGAIATGWAASVQPTYAPELNIKGWAFGGTPANTTSTLQNVEGTVYAGFAIAGLAGTMAAYPVLTARVNEIATARGLAAIAKVKTQCDSADLADFLFVNIENTAYTSLGSQLLYDPVIAPILANGTMATASSLTPTAPAYMYHGQSDEVIPYASALKAAVTWCANSASIEFVTENGGTGHVGTSEVLGKNATDWLELRLSGVAPAAGCSFSTYSAAGSPFKRDGNSVLARFGVGDELITADIKQRLVEGRSIPSLWSYPRML
ncbi:hypothetical protein HWV62_39964 [Athelia sp. TMB]|nr:hypothetical protein HWV62_39964 [Athelia sp. TMB]